MDRIYDYLMHEKIKKSITFSIFIKYPFNTNKNYDISIYVLMSVSNANSIYDYTR